MNRTWLIAVVAGCLLSVSACVDRPPADAPADDPGAGTAPAAPPASDQGDEIPAGDPVPDIALRDDGYADGVWSFSVATNLELTLDTGPYEPMRGHIHVYLDGVEIQMLDTKRITLADLSSGAHVVRVALASTTHRNLLHDGVLIADSLDITVP